MCVYIYIYLFIYIYIYLYYIYIYWMFHEESSKATMPGGHSETCFCHLAKQAIIQGSRQSQNVRQQSVKSHQKSGMVRENNCRKPAILHPKLQSVSNIILYPTLW